jgi:hypothetical protein
LVAVEVAAVERRRTEAMRKFIVDKRQGRIVAAGLVSLE